MRYLHAIVSFLFIVAVSPKPSEIILHQKYPENPYIVLKKRHHVLKQTQEIQRVKIRTTKTPLREGKSLWHSKEEKETAFGIKPKISINIASFVISDKTEQGGSYVRQFQLIKDNLSTYKVNTIFDDNELSNDTKSLEVSALLDFNLDLSEIPETLRSQTIVTITPPNLVNYIRKIGLGVARTYTSIKKTFPMYFDVEYLESSTTSILQVARRSKDAKMDIKYLVKKSGHKLEKHRVTTSDGYILTMHRIVPKKRSKNTPVVFLMHGVTGSSDSWILQGPDKALAYLLSDAGFDVWMGNARGNKYSLKHTTFKSRNPAFWSYSWEEIAINDLPAMIDYALNKTGQEKLYYVGHSQGTTCFYVLTSMKPEYNDKFEKMFALSPVAFMGHVKSPIIKLFMPANKLLNYWFSNVNTYRSVMDYFNRIMGFLCYWLPRCDSLLSMLVGGNYGNINATLLPVIFSHTPTGSSTKEFTHYGQLVQSGRFARFDYGKNKNMEIYASEEPPDYEITNIRVPLVLFYSENDWLSDPQDVSIFKSQISNNVVSEYTIDNFNHMDFMYATRAKDFIYLNIIKEINSTSILGT